MVQRREKENKQQERLDIFHGYLQETNTRILLHALQAMDPELITVEVEDGSNDWVWKAIKSHLDYPHDPVIIQQEKPRKTRDMRAIQDKHLVRHYLFRAWQNSMDGKIRLT